MNKKIVTLSDTSHPFTTVIHNSDDSVTSWQNDPKHNVEPESDKGIRTLTSQEFAAIDAFLRDWGFVGNHDISDDLVDMLADETTNAFTRILRFLRKWNLDRDEFNNAIRTDLENLFILRITVMPEFSDDEVKALESLEGEKSDETLRRELFREEADKRVNRYFIGQSGWAWFVHFIVDMPEFYDEIHPLKALLPAKDGMTTLHMTNLFMNEQEAWKAIETDIRLTTSYDDAALTHVYELDKM